MNRRYHHQFKKRRYCGTSAAHVICDELYHGIRIREIMYFGETLYLYTVDGFLNVSRNLINVKKRIRRRFKILEREYTCQWYFKDDDFTLLSDVNKEKRKNLEMNINPD